MKWKEVGPGVLSGAAVALLCFAGSWALALPTQSDVEKDVTGLKEEIQETKRELKETRDELVSLRIAVAELTTQMKMKDGGD